MQLEPDDFTLADDEEPTPEVLCPFDGMIVCRHGCTRPDQRACVDGP